MDNKEIIKITDEMLEQIDLLLQSKPSYNKVDLNELRNKIVEIQERY
jgi:hypothetical protein